MEKDFGFKAGLRTVFYVFILAVLLSTGAAEAGNSVSLNGWAWSPNIGWISFNCANESKCPTSDYVVNWDDESGNLSGYAWSGNVGWISFENTDVQGCPNSPCGPKLDKNTGIMSGWARALANGGGWDGWVNLNCGNVPGLCAASDYKGQIVPAPASGGVDFKNWIFGRGDVLGWISFNCLNSGVCGDSNYKVSLTPTNPPSVIFTVAPNPINYNGVATLTWSATNALSCTSPDGSFNPGGAVSGSVSTGNVTTYPTKTYTIRCTGLGGSIDASVVLNVRYEFTLNPPNPISVTIVGGASAKSSNTTIRVTPIGGFNQPITLTAVQSTDLPPQTQYNFSDTNLTSREYNTGSQFYVIIPPGSTLSASYPITIQGTGGGITRTTVVTLNATKKSPIFEEE
ncbi:MAG TPA: hypothetical protein VJJ73_02475 [Candidatus Paceibacterota bacterium]